jgi:predicted dehydrogenase
MPSPTRRALLFTGAGAALAAQQGGAVRLPRKLRLGVVGWDGHVGEVIRCLPQLPDVQLTGVAEAASNPAGRASFLRNQFVARARQYRTVEEMLSREELDVAAVCNNDGDRASAVVACLNRKLNVIAEKPLATSRKDLDAIYAARKKTGKHVGMLLPMRFTPRYLAMKRLIAAGAVGEALQIDGQKSYQLGHRPEWQQHARTYGSTILWIGIHMIDLMAWTTGRQFTEVASYQSRVRFPELGDMQNVTASIFKLDNGGTATLRMDYLRPAAAKGHGDDRLRVAGTEGIIENQEEAGLILMGAKTPPRKVEDLPPQGSVFLDFLQSVYNDARPELSWPDIVRANEFTLAAHEAAEMHQFRAIRKIGDEA